MQGLGFRGYQGSWEFRDKGLGLTNSMPTPKKREPIELLYSDNDNRLCWAYPKP